MGINECIIVEDLYNSFQKLKVTMTKHPSSFKLNGDLKTKNEEVKDVKVILYDGKQGEGQ